MKFVELVASRCPAGVSYDDAVNLCLAMYCVVLLPPGIEPSVWTPSAIADEFAELGRRRVIHGEGANPIVDERGRALLVSDAAHWEALIERLLREGDFPDIATARALVS